MSNKGFTFDTDTPVDAIDASWLQQRWSYVKKQLKINMFRIFSEVNEIFK